MPNYSQMLITFIYVFQMNSSITSCRFKRNYITVERALCMDGSKPTFYFRKGGGWCKDVEKCDKRSRTKLGSSLQHVDCRDKMSIDHAYLSSDPAYNKAMYNFNTVYVSYCDGSSFSGNSQKTFQQRTLYFHGLHNRMGLIRELQNKYNLSTASEIVISGQSAGGLSVYLGIDQMVQMLHEVNSSSVVLGLVDSGFFPNYDSPYLSKGILSDEKRLVMDHQPYDVGGASDGDYKNMLSAETNFTTTRAQYGSKMKSIFNLMGMASGTPSSCLSKYPKSPEICVFAENLVPHIKTPLFHLQPTYDSWQLENILGYPLLDLDADNHEQTSVINQFGMNMSNSLLAVIPDSKSAVFFDSCLHHGYYRMFHVVTDSTLMTANEAFFIWYREMVIGHGREGIAYMKPKIYSQIESYPCESCCPKGQVGQRK